MSRMPIKINIFHRLTFILKAACTLWGRNWIVCIVRSN